MLSVVRNCRQSVWRTWFIMHGSHDTHTDVTCVTAVISERWTVHESDGRSWKTATECISFTKESTCYFNSQKGTNVHLPCYVTIKLLIFHTIAFMLAKDWLFMSLNASVWYATMISLWLDMLTISSQIAWFINCLHRLLDQLVE